MDETIHAWENAKMEFVRTCSKELTKRRTVKILCFIIPVMLLLIGYVYMIFQYDRIWLFNTIVHENGRYTLWEVILYFRHFIWELPIKTLYAVVLTGLFLHYGNPPSRTQKDDRVTDVPYTAVFISGLLAVAFTGIAFTYAIEKIGFHETMTGFLQYRTSELRSPEFGSHWRNHFLSNIVLVSTSAVCIAIYRIFTGGYWVKRRYAGLLPFGIVVFAVFSVIFGINKDPFTETSYLGHQVREIFGTDVSVTMLLSLGVLIHLENKYDLIPHYESDRKKHKSLDYYGIYVWLVVALATTTYLIVKVMQLNLSKEISTRGGARTWTAFDLFAWHFYEHSTDYIFTMSAVAFIYLVALKYGSRKLNRY